MGRSIEARITVTALLAASFIARGSAATTPQNDDVDRKPTYRFGLSVDMVHLSVAALKKDRLVTDLKQEHFQVLEDGVPQEIAYFSKGTDAPVDIFLLVDASGSMDMVEKVANARKAAIELIQSLDDVDRVAVYGFDKDLFELSGFSEDKHKAIRALAELEPFGTTAIHDAVARAATVIEQEGFGRRAVVLVTDGMDTSSQLSLDEAVEAARRVELPVYSIRVVSPLDDPASESYLRRPEEAQPPPPDSMQVIARESGGRLFQGSDLETLRLISLKIREELKTQYRLGYAPSQPVRDRSFRRIEVKIDRRGVEARTRKGYYPTVPKTGEGAQLRESPSSK